MYGHQLPLGVQFASACANIACGGQDRVNCQGHEVHSQETRYSNDGLQFRPRLLTTSRQWSYRYQNFETQCVPARSLQQREALESLASS
jgi:elongation factor P hydroxylase